MKQKTNEQKNINKRQYKKINRDNLVNIISELDIDTNIYDNTGNFSFKKYNINISLANQSIKQRVLFLYHKRKHLGLCVYCGIKITKINKNTNKLYRMCELHRKMFYNKKID